MKTVMLEPFSRGLVVTLPSEREQGSEVAVVTRVPISRGARLPTSEGKGTFEVSSLPGNPDQHQFRKQFMCCDDEPHVVKGRHVTGCSWVHFVRISQNPEEANITCWQSGSQLEFRAAEDISANQILVMHPKPMEDMDCKVKIEQEAKDVATDVVSSETLPLTTLNDKMKALWRTPNHDLAIPSPETRHTQQMTDVETLSSNDVTPANTSSETTPEHPTDKSGEASQSLQATPVSSKRPCTGVDGDVSFGRSLCGALDLSSRPFSTEPPSTSAEKVRPNSIFGTTTRTGSPVLNRMETDASPRERNKGRRQAKVAQKRTTRKMRKCPYCPREFDRPSLLDRHVRKHTGEKPFACTVCGKAFSTSSSKNTHVRIHTKQKPHKCPTCGKCFTASSNLYYHKMTHQQTKPYPCQHCSKSFPTPGDLKNHTYTHTGQYPVWCSVCNRGFPKQSNLKAHMKTHDARRTYDCKLCKTCFPSSTDLRSHMKSHPGKEKKEKLRRCRGCQRSTSDEGGGVTLVCGLCGACRASSSRSPSSSPSPSSDSANPLPSTSGSTSSGPSSTAVKPEPVAKSQPTNFTIDRLIGLDTPSAKSSGERALDLSRSAPPPSSSAPPLAGGPGAPAPLGSSSEQAASSFLPYAPSLYLPSAFNCLPSSYPHFGLPPISPLSTSSYAPFSSTPLPSHVIPSSSVTPSTAMCSVGSSSFPSLPFSTAPGLSSSGVFAMTPPGPGAAAPRSAFTPPTYFHPFVPPVHFTGIFHYAGLRPWGNDPSSPSTSVSGVPGRPSGSCLPPQ